MRRSMVIGALAVLGSSFAIAADSDIETSASSTRRVLYVANNGTDSINCGNWGSPCRTISQAIDNAVDGDQIEVGPGLYGDLNSDGDFDDPGDEPPRRVVGDGECVVCVFKRLGIYSQKGATATTINVPFNSIQHVYDIVHIGANGVTFGRPDGGFTIVGGTQTRGMLVDAGHVRIVGNISLGNSNASGFVLSPSNSNGNDSGFVLNGSISVVDNVARGNLWGFTVLASDIASNRVVLDGDIATDNAEVGFDISPHYLLPAPAATTGYTVEAKNCRSSRNHLGGFRVAPGPYKIVRNIVTDNTTGFVVQNPRATSAPPLQPLTTFSENSVIGNLSDGLIFFDTEGRTYIVRNNNIFGNHDCGLRNTSGTTPLDAAGNYWGAPSGPGSDPADNAGPGCDNNSNGSRTITQPFAKKAFPIN